MHLLIHMFYIVCGYGMGCVYLYMPLFLVCLVVNPITVGNFAFLFNCTPVGRTSDSMMVPT